MHRQPRADHAGREDEHLLGVEPEQPRRPRRRSRSASSLPRSPVAAFATPELITTACGCGEREVLAVDLQAGGLNPVAREHRAAGRARQRADDARSFPSRRIAARRRPERDEALRRAVTLTAHFTPSQAQARGLGQAEREVRVLHRLAGGAFAEVVLAQITIAVAGRRVVEERRSRRRRVPCTRCDLRRYAPGSTRTTSLPAYAASSSARSVGDPTRRNTSRAGRAGSAGGGGRT